MNTQGTLHFLRQKGYALTELAFYLLAFLATLAVCGHPFFWDTIQLGAKHANYFYFSDFQSLILPAELDSGHPPAFGLYLAFVWKVLNRSLPVSHCAMLPFLWGIIFFLLRIGERLAGKKAAPWLVLLCFADPVLATQCILVSPDVALVCFFLMAVWAILAEGPTPVSAPSAGRGRFGTKDGTSKVWLALAITGLALVSMRGMMLCAGLYLFSLCLKLGGSLKLAPNLSIKLALNTFWPFLPGALLAGGFLFYHWQQTGWVAYHAASTWAPSFERVDVQGFAKNLAVLAWRMCDFGRVFVWGCLAALVLFFWRKKADWNQLQEGKKLLWLLGLVFVAIVPTQLLYKGLLAHRYLLPVFLCLNLLLFWALFSDSATKPMRFLKPHRFRNALYALAFLGLLTGNLWNYPDKISMGWDSTLAHLPWYELKDKMNGYIEREMRMHEQRHQIGTAFPNLASDHHTILLMGGKEAFAEKDLSQNCYIFWSNIMNDFTDAELDELRSEWKVLKHLQKGQVEVILYQNPHLECEN